MVEQAPKISVFKMSNLDTIRKKIYFPSMFRSLTINQCQEEISVVVQQAAPCLKGAPTVRRDLHPAFSESDPASGARPNGPSAEALAGGLAG